MVAWVRLAKGYAVVAWLVPELECCVVASAARCVAAVLEDAAALVLMIVGRN